MGSLFRPNNEYWMRSRTKIIKGALLGGDSIFACPIGRGNEVAVSESRESARAAYLGLITIIGNGRALKL